MNRFYIIPPGTDTASRQMSCPSPGAELDLSCVQAIEGINIGSVSTSFDLHLGNDYINFICSFHEDDAEAKAAALELTQKVHAELTQAWREYRSAPLPAICYTHAPTGYGSVCSNIETGAL